jgi:hypothetical protein
MCLLFTARNLNNKINNYIKMFMLNFVFFNADYGYFLFLSILIEIFK